MRRLDVSPAILLPCGPKSLLASYSDICLGEMSERGIPKSAAVSFARRSDA
jgi:hypothetical protein